MISGLSGAYEVSNLTSQCPSWLACFLSHIHCRCQSLRGFLRVNLSWRLHGKHFSGIGIFIFLYKTSSSGVMLKAVVHKGYFFFSSVEFCEEHWIISSVMPSLVSLKVCGKSLVRSVGSYSRGGRSFHLYPAFRASSLVKGK